MSAVDARGAVDGKDDRAMLKKHIDQVDAIMGFEGFAKTPDAAALDAAELAGRITSDEAMQFLQLSARMAGTRSVLEAIGPHDLRYPQMKRHYEANLVTLRAIAERCGPEVVKAFGL